MGSFSEVGCLMGQPVNPAITSLNHFEESQITLFIYLFIYK